MTSEDESPEPRAELEELRARLAEAEETLRAIRDGEVDALVFAGQRGDEVHLLGGGDRIYRQFIEAISEGSATLSAGGEILSCNAALAKTLRRPLDQVLGTAMRDHLPPEDQETFGAVLAQAGLESFRSKIHLKTSEGALVPVYLAATLLRGAGVEPVRSLVFTDLEEVISAEETLRREYDRAQLYLDTVETIIVVLDSQGRITRINRKGCTILEWSEEELLGRLWFATCLPQPEGLENVYPHFLRLMAGEQETTEYFENPIVTKSGELRQIAWHNALLRDDQGKINGTLSSGEDITEQLRLAEEKAGLEDQLRQAQKVEAIGRLAGGVAHDFNNLTAIVLGYGEMLLGQLRPDEPARKWAEQIVAAGKRSALLTRQLLAFSRRQVLLPVVLDVNELFRNLEKMLGRLIGEDIAMTFKLDGDLGRVTADPGQIEQVVTNLVINARDAMPHGGRLIVETANVELDETFAADHNGVVPGEYVRIGVTDTGCGMDKATLARLFEPFFTTKKTGKGTGLGLATAFGVVKQSGGYLYVDSESDKGATFTIYLPLTYAQPKATAIESPGETLRGAGERVLLVEDEGALRELCATMLSRLGYRVSSAASGPEALHLMGEQGFEPDLVLTDVVMPGMSGAEMAKRLQRDRPGLKVLYMSGYPDDAIAPHGVLGPGISLLQKPFSEDVLAVKVSETLGRREPAARPARRVLMIDDDEQYRELVGHFCRKRGHVFAGVDSAAAALAALAGQSFDVLLVDLNIPGTSGADVLRKIRAAGHTAPAIVLTGDVASADMDLLRPLGAVQALEKSSDAGSLLQAIGNAQAPGGTSGQ